MELSSNQDELKREYKELNVIKELIQKLATNFDLKSVMENVVDSIRELFPDLVVSYVIIPIGAKEISSVIYVHSSIKMNDMYLEEVKRNIFSGIEAIPEKLKSNFELKAYRQKKIHFELINTQKDKKSKKLPQFWINIPITLSGTIGGLINVSSFEDCFFDKKELDVIYTIIASASQAIERLKILVELEHSRFSDLIRSMINGVVMFDKNRDMVVVNPAACDVMGCPVGRKKIKDFLTLFNEEDRLRIELAIDNAIDKVKLTRFDEVRISKEIFQVFITPVRNSDKKVYGGAIILYNITQQKKYEEEIKKRSDRLEMEKSVDEAILSSLGDGVMVIDKDRKTFLFNEAAEKILGHKAEDVLNEDYRNYTKFCFQNGSCLLPDDFPTEKTLRTGEIFATDLNNLIYYERPNGSSFPVYVKVSPIKLGKEVIGVVVIFRDITQEEAIDRMKTEFVSIASHQLRAPLSVMNWNIEMLLSGDAGRLSELQREFLEEIYRGGKRTIQLINDLLNVSYLDTGRLRIDPKSIQLEDFIENVFNEIKALVKEDKKYSFIFKKPVKRLPKIFIDPSLTRQVLSNLMVNAIHFSSSKRKPNIAVEILVPELKSNKTFRQLELERYGNVIISVKDNGIGIPKKVQSRVFEKFFRARNAFRIKAEGSGLGMYVAKMIIEACGGKIWFKSKVGKGSTFYISIPMKGMKRSDVGSGLNVI